jgi:RNA polymerase sigma-70 factor, ECF subfamily
MTTEPKTPHFTDREKAALIIELLELRLRLENMAYHTFRNREIAEDLAQEAMLRAFNAINNDRYNGKSGLSTYTFSILRNLLSDQFRIPKGPKTTRLNDENAEFYGPSDPTDHFAHLFRQATMAEIYKAVKKLPRDQKEAIEMVYLLGDEKMTYNAAAEILGTTETSIRNRLSRGLKALREILNPQSTYVGALEEQRQMPRQSGFEK